MGDMRNDIHDGPCSRQHYCDSHCPERLNSEAGMGQHCDGICSFDDDDEEDLPPVLDACCGSRMFWFDRRDNRAIFVDKHEGTRIVDIGTHGTIGRKPIVVAPDKIADFTCLPFPDEAFWHVVFDPPHFHRGAGSTGKLAFQYGLLPENWREMLQKGFAECFRVLKPKGTLIFKWSAVEFSLREVLALTPQQPLYGHRSGKKATTHWIAFLKT